MANYRQVETKKINPLLPFIGFVMIVVIGGFSYLIAPAAIQWMSTAQWTLVGTPVLPLAFPSTWPPDVVRWVVTLGLFLVIFVLAMIPLMIMMGSTWGETDVSLKVLRDEKKKQRRGRGHRV